MPNDADAFSLHDATLTIACPVNGPNWIRDTAELNVRWTIHNLVMRVLGESGFKLGADRTITKHYKSLGKYHRHGRCGVLEVATEIHPALMQVEFFQNVNIENRNGGRHDFDRVAKMPYLARLEID